MWEKFTSSSKRVVKIAHEEAKLVRMDHVGSEHLLLGIISDRNSLACKVMVQLNIDLDELDVKIRQNLESGMYEFDSLNFGQNAKKVLEGAYKEARSQRLKFIDSAHILLAILNLPDSKAYNHLDLMGLEYRKFKELFELKLERDLDKFTEDREAIEKRPEIGMGKVKFPPIDPNPAAREPHTDAIWTKFTSSSKRLIKYAHEEAKHFRNDAVDLEHLLLGVLRDENSFAFKALVNLEVNPEIIKSQIIEDIPIGNFDFESINFSTDAKKVLDLANQESQALGNEFIGAEHILLGLLHMKGSKVIEILHRHNVTLDKLRYVLQSMSGQVDPSTRQKIPVSNAERDLRYLVLRSQYSFEAESILRMAIQFAKDRGDWNLSPEDFLFAILKLEPLEITAFLNKYGVTYDSAKQYFDDTKKGTNSGENPSDTPPDTGSE